MSDEEALQHRSRIPELRQQLEQFREDLFGKEVPKREYEFVFKTGAENELRDYQQVIDHHLGEDLDQLERRNDREEKAFLRQIAKLDEVIRDQERLEFEKQDDQYSHLKQIPREWELHKDAQGYEAKQREQVRGVFYTEIIRDFVREHGDLHFERLEALHAQNDLNVQILNEAYAERQPSLEGIVQALEEARDSLQHINPPKPANDELARPAAVGDVMERFHSLVMAGREHEQERER